jgi:hypothetical protein
MEKFKDTNENSINRQEKVRDFFVETAESVLRGEYIFADSAMDKLQEIDPNGEDEYIQSLLKKLPEAEIRNCISIAISALNDGDVGNAFSWVGHARQSLRRFEIAGLIDSSVLEELDESFIDVYNQVVSNID